MSCFRPFYLGFFYFLIFSSFLDHSSQADPIASVDQLYENSSASPLLSMINASKTSIDIEIYTMKDPAVISALTSALNRGVKLRVVQTDYTLDSCAVFEAPSSSDDSSCKPLKAFVTYVRNHNGEYVPFNNVLCGTPGTNCFQHGKILISDGNKILISTGNFDPTSLCDLSQSPTTCNRDFALVSEDSNVISTIQTIFNQDLVGNAFDLGSILKTPAAARINVSPDSMAPIVAFIQSAKKSIQLENQYLEDPTMNQALIDAAKRGVQVFAMAESVSAFGKLNPKTDSYDINRWTNTYTAFDQAGIHTKIFNGSMLIENTPGYLHAKVILVDSKTAWIGSVNGSTQSLTQNREFGIFSSDPQVVKTLNTVIYGDFNNSHAETWQESLACKKDPKATCNSTSGGTGEIEKRLGN